jgi:hypothetical protein
MRKPSIHEEDAGTVTDNTPPLLPLSARNTHTKDKILPRHLPEIDTESYYKSTEIPSSTYFFHTTGAMYTQLKIKMVTLTLKRQHCGI